MTVLAVRSRLFSAHAEVFPEPIVKYGVTPSLLRTRGGISKVKGVYRGSALSSPHTRRYFPSKWDISLAAGHFSAHAEVVLRYQASSAAPTLWLSLTPTASAAPTPGSTPRTRAAPARAPSTRPTTGGSAGKRPAARSRRPPRQRAPTSILHRNRP